MKAVRPGTIIARVHPSELALPADQQTRWRFIVPTADEVDEMHDRVRRELKGGDKTRAGECEKRVLLKFLCEPENLLVENEDGSGESAPLEWLTKPYQGREDAPDPHMLSFIPITWRDWLHGAIMAQGRVRELDRGKSSS